MSKIDVHAHVVPPKYRDALLEKGSLGGWHLPEWSPEIAMKVQDELGIKTSVLSITAPGCSFLDEAGNRTLARESNEYCAQVKRDHPERFGYYVNLPNPATDMDGCIAEIAHGLEHLVADGVALLTSYDGMYLGNPKLASLWNELNKRSATVLIHPTPPLGYRPVADQPLCPAPLFDFPHETTRTVSDIIMSGRRSECPNVKIILCHGGGTLPFLAERITHLSQDPHLHNPLPADTVMDQLKGLYYDTALCGFGPAFRCTVDFVPDDHLVIGSDHPFASPRAMVKFAKGVDGYEWTTEQRARLYEGNARKLFPMLR